MIIGITGTLGAGKGTVVEFLKQKGFKHFSVREFLIKEINKRGLPVNRDNMVLVANQLRKMNSPSYIIEQLYEQAKKAGGDCIIESIRTPGEVEALKEKGGVLLAIDADPQTRYVRIVTRQSETDNVSYDEFLENEKREMFSQDPNKQNLSKCIEMADYVLDNNKGVEELHKQVEEIYNKIISRDAQKITKRKDYISWDEYFMGVAVLSAMRSKDPNTQVGACIVDEHNHIIATGYNGFPIGCSDDVLPWEREGEKLKTKYPYVVHAEQNAITNATKDLNGCRIYVPLFPCNECAKLIIQSRIKEVIYISNKYALLDEFVASRKILEMAGIKLRQYSPENKQLILDFFKLA